MLSVRRGIEKVGTLHLPREVGTILSVRNVALLSSRLEHEQ